MSTFSANFHFWVNYSMKAFLFVLCLFCFLVTLLPNVVNMNISEDKLESDTVKSTEDGGRDLTRLQRVLLTERRGCFLELNTSVSYMID